MRQRFIYEISNPNGSLPKPSPQEVSENSRKEVGKKKGRCQFHMTVFTKEYKSRPHNVPQEESSLLCVNNNKKK